MKHFPFVLTALALTTNLASAIQLPHQDLRWGVDNSGNNITIDLSLNQTYRLQALKDEDVQLHSPMAKARKVKVAILDTGIDYTHPDLAHLIYKNKLKCEAYEKIKKCTEKITDDSESAEVDAAKECRESNLAAEPNVYPADCLGWSVLNKGITNTPNNIIGRPDFTDSVGHGTHVAGIIASVTQNIEIIPVQVLSEAPNQPIKPFSIDLSPSEDVRNGFQRDESLSERIARGIIYAMNSGAEVINLSLGWLNDQDSEIMREAVAEAQRRGIIFVAAAGNDSTTALLRPCQYKGVICVAAHRPDGALASFSNFGYGVDIAAPGVEILSALPMVRRSVRLPGFKGYDFMSGTSQATPFVTGAVAEMLSRGIPADEIYARLILGARLIKPETAVIRGPINTAGTKIMTPQVYQKHLLSGLLDIKNAVAVKAQALILSADKETPVIIWDRKKLDLQFSFKLKNYWAAITDKKVTVEVQSRNNDIIFPEVTSVQLSNAQSGWASQQEKDVQVSLRIRDQAQGYLSRLPSELSYIVTVKLNGAIHRQFETKAEVVVSVKKDMKDPEIAVIPVVGSLNQGESLTLVDEVYDNQQGSRDYLVFGSDPKIKNTFRVGLTQFNEGKYVIGKTQDVAFKGEFKNAVFQQKIRIDLDGDGRSEYFLRFMEYENQEAKAFRVPPYKDHLLVFNSDMVLQTYSVFDDYRLMLPFQFQWMRIGQSLRPAWIGQGQEVRTEFNILDLMGKPKGKPVKTPVGINLYYLTEDFKLAQLAAPQNLRFVDLVHTELQNVQNGIISVLMAKNSGNEIKQSYINEFFVGTATNGKLTEQRALNVVETIGYRNLIDTFMDKTLNLRTNPNEFAGTMWYGLDTHQRQRVTVLDTKTMALTDKLISSQRAVFDAALMVRAGFQSQNRKGVFLITNSELEYHDLNSNQIATRSLERYSFLGEAAFVNLQFPITVNDQAALQQKLPALFTAENSGVSRGHRFLVPIVSDKGVKSQIVVPAKLRLLADKGCRPENSPVFLGQSSGYAMDYFCGDRILRIKLNY